MAHPLLGFDSVPEYPGYVLLDLVRTAERAVLDIDDFNRVLFEAHGLLAVEAVTNKTAMAIEPLLISMWTETLGDLGWNNEAVPSGKAGVLITIWNEADGEGGRRPGCPGPPVTLDDLTAAGARVTPLGPVAVEGTVTVDGKLEPFNRIGLAARFVSRTGRVEVYEIFCDAWNEAVDFLTESKTATDHHHRTDRATPRGQANLRRACNGLATEFDRWRREDELERLLYNPERDSTMYRLVAFNRVLAVYETHGVVFRVADGPARRDAVEQAMSDDTADVLALALARETRADPDYVSTSLKTMGRLVEWALAVARDAGCVHTNRNRIYAALRVAGVISEGDSKRGSTKGAALVAAALLERSSQLPEDGRMTGPG